MNSYGVIMKGYKMDKRLITFLEICETMNYRKAAEMLHLTQPALTKHIQALEVEYGIKLFEFDGRKLNRSEESYLLESYARSQRVNYENIIEKFKVDNKRKLRIGFTKTIGNYDVLDSLSNYINKSETEISLVVENTEKLLCMLKENNLDFVMLEGNFDKTLYDYRLYSDEVFTGICSKKHRFAGKKIEIKDLFEECLLLREEGSGSRGILESLLYHKGYTVKNFSRLITTNSIKLLSDLVAQNLGITFAYEKISKGRDSLACFEVEGITSKHEFNIVGLKGTDYLDVAEEVMGFLKSNTH